MGLVIHGKTKGGLRSPEYVAYHNMIMRCHNPNDKSYKYYGGRGIIVCDRWRHSFENFFKDMGSRPDSHTLERNNTDGNYTPKNCKWATMAEQSANKRNSILIEYNGEIKTASKWGDSLGINKTTIVNRYRKGLPPEVILIKGSLQKLRFISNCGEPTDKLKELVKSKL